MTMSLLRPVIGAVIGAAVGFAFCKFVGCRSGACPLTGNPWMAMFWWGMIGVMAPGLMLKEQASPLGLDATVAAITNKAVAAGWTVSSVMPLDQSVKKHGGDPGRPVRLINLCQAQHASAILLDDKARVATTLMPCTISVYETASGPPLPASAPRRSS